MTKTVMKPVVMKIAVAMSPIAPITTMYSWIKESSGEKSDHEGCRTAGIGAVIGRKQSPKDSADAGDAAVE